MISWCGFRQSQSQGSRGNQLNISLFQPLRNYFDVVLCPSLFNSSNSHLVCSIETIMQTIMGIKAPMMILRPAREQLQWPVQEARLLVQCAVFNAFFVSFCCCRCSIFFINISSEHIQQAAPRC